VALRAAVSHVLIKIELQAHKTYISSRQESAGLIRTMTYVALRGTLKHCIKVPLADNGISSQTTFDL
ncbi:MAG: hypothetical protein PHW98_01120, partial [Candidatus Omnitrophica bacterium]|nr:hypothetical protein [Candidatus Omnitrophota bacterium]